VVRYLAAEAGIRHFLDTGTGLPTSPNVHEVTQCIISEVRIVYVDDDPLVLAHARALLSSSPAGRTAYIQADLREPDKILADPAVHGTLDLSQPVTLMLVAVLHFIANQDDPAGLVAALLAALSPGSYLVASHISLDHDPAGVGAAERAYRASGVTAQPRTAEEFGRVFFRGLELVPPGVTLVSEWRPDESGLRPKPGEVNSYGAVGRKPGAPPLA
jgi:S-adenosyl methyltransferase